MLNTTKAFLTSIALVGLSATAASANVVTADSIAWENDSTLEVGASFRSYDHPVHKVREVHVPAVKDCQGRIISHAYSYHQNYTVLQNFQTTTGNGKISKKIGSDFLTSIGYDSKAYGAATVRNGNLTGTTGVNTDGKVYGSIAFSPVKNIALIYHAQSNVSAIGAQVQIGSTSIMGAYNTNGGGYSIGLGQEVGLSGKTPTFRLQPVASAEIKTGGEVIVITPKVVSLPKVAKPTTLAPKPGYCQVMGANGFPVIKPCVAPADVKYIRGRG